ncbi:MAG: PAS domain S-box protein [Gemmataceae bacterium]
MSSSEESLLRSAAWQNAEAIRAAKRHAEEELARAMETLEQRSQALTQALAMTQATLEATPDGILATDAAGQVTEVNDNFLRMWRLPSTLRAPDQLPTLLVAVAQQLGDPTAFLDRMEALSTQADSFDLLDLPDGRVFERYSRPKMVDGAAAGRVWVFRDVSERKRAEESLYLRDRAVRAIPLGLVITDPNQDDNPIIYVNPAFETLTGYPAAEVLGRNCRFLQGKESDPATVQQLRECIQAGIPITTQLVNYRKDGSMFRNELAISPVRDSDGKIVHFIGIQTDVTERFQLEEMLRQSQKMEAVGRLAGGIAHDFNNLLTVINGFTELALNGLPGNQPLRTMLEEVRKAGGKAAGLTQQLLAFSRRSILAPQVLNVNRLLQDLEPMLRPLLGEDIDLALQLAPDLQDVRADPAQLEQALVNLCVNAREAMPMGGRLTLETRNVTLDSHYAALHLEVNPGLYVQVAITDTGRGIPPEIQRRLFEPFSTTKEFGQGAGLGLPMVFGFAKQSGGHVSVYSELGEGTTFKLYLPLIAPTDLTTSMQSIADLPRGDETVLVVEDDPGVRQLALQILGLCGYQVLEASHGREALRLIRGHPGPLHLLLTDVVIPGGMGGRELAGILHTLRPETQVLFMSGYTDDAVIRHGVLQEGSAFLQKPFTPLALSTRVRQLLEQRR